MTNEEFEEFVSTVAENEVTLTELRSRMRAVLADESRLPRERVAEYRKLLNQAKLYAENIERAWELLQRAL